MAMDQKAREALKKTDLCRDGRELFRISKQSVSEKKDAAGVSFLKDKSGAMKVSLVISRNSGRSIWIS